MDFFEHQEVARRKTTRLIVYFTLAVTAIVACVYLAVVLIFAGFGWQVDEAGQTVWTWWQPALFFPALAGTIGVVSAGSAYKTMSLASGSHVVAENLGGRLVNRNATNRDERVLLNVVDEMAIASGVPSPPVFLLENEEGINAFAAGYQTDDAVIGVTKGCVKWLSRDELQGVVAHEFSHILNGDMRLNLRLMGLLHGILLIGLTGYWIMRSTRGGGSKGRGGGIVLMGLALFVIGYVGVFFAKLIKAGVSRQREYLADASAVQFTRNPEGIAGALKKIGGVAKNARIENSQAEQASHMFFGNALKRSFLGMFSTHPPLEVRIRRIDPSFDGRVPKPQRPKRSDDDIRPLSGFQPATAGRWSDTVAFKSDDAIEHVGNPQAEDVAEAKSIELNIPNDVHALISDAFGARAAVYGLLLDQDADVRSKQLARLEDHADRAVVRELRKHLPSLDCIAPEARLPVVELAIPALKQLTRDQYRAFRENLNQLIRADEEYRLFEFLLRRMVLTHLRHLEGRKRTKRLRSAEKVATAGADLLAALARVGHANESDAAAAFDRAMQTFLAAYGKTTVDAPLGRLDLAAADRALGRLSNCSTTIKRRLLKACAACIETDGVATVEEVELLRVIAETLDCPLPPQFARFNATELRAEEAPDAQGASAASASRSSARNR